MSGKSEFSCAACGRRFAWKPTIAGKKAKCKCGEKIAVPETDPAEAEPESFAGFELDLPDDAADIGVAPAQPAPSAPTKCVACNHPLKPGAVICLNCGTDQRTGAKLTTGVDQFSDKERRREARAATLSMLSLRIVQVGIWGSFTGVLVKLVGAICMCVGLYMVITLQIGVTAGLLLAGGQLLMTTGVVIGLISSIVCLAVPGQQLARFALALSITLGAASVGLLAYAIYQTVVGSGDFTFWKWMISEGLSILGSVSFIWFLYLLSVYLSIGAVIDRARSTMGWYVTYAVCAMIIVLPVIPVWVIILYPMSALWSNFLYILLIIELHRAISFRIDEAKQEA